MLSISLDSRGPVVAASRVCGAFYGYTSAAPTIKSKVQGGADSIDEKAMVPVALGGTRYRSVVSWSNADC
jgi:hypothetical protein